MTKKEAHRIENYLSNREVHIGEGIPLAAEFTDQDLRNWFVLNVDKARKIFLRNPGPTGANAILQAALDREAAATMSLFERKQKEARERAANLPGTPRNPNVILVGPGVAGLTPEDSKKIGDAFKRKGQ